MKTLSNSEVLVCGVGGPTGDAVLAALVGRGIPCRAFVHSQSRREAALALGASSVFVGDYDDPATLERAMAAVSGVFFVAPVYQQAEPAWVQNAIEAADSASVEHFVYQSVLHAYTPSMPHHVRKAESEVLLRSSSLQWSVLQPAMYAQTVLRVRARSAPGRLQVPYSPDSAFTVIDVHDIAECVAAVMLEEPHMFATYELAGGEQLSLREMGHAMDQATGEDRIVEQVDPASLDLPDSWSERQREEYALMCAEYNAHGLLGAATTTRYLLGGPPVTFGEVALRELGTRGTR